MRIGIDTQITVGEKTGFGYYVSNLTKNLQAIDRQNEYVFFKPQTVKDFSTPQRMIWDQVTIPRLANRAQVDILHQSCFSEPVFYHGKSVVTVHDLTAIFLGYNIPFWSRQFYAKWVPFTYRYANHLITVSQQTKRDIMDILAIPEDKITVIYEAASEKYQVIDDQAAIKQVREKYRLGNEPIILHVGTLEPRKNLPFLVKAFSIAKKKYHTTSKLVITGKKGWYYESLFRLVESLGLGNEVIFTGYLEDQDIPLLYNAASTLVFPSFYEGFGLPPLEAMASGTPVVSSNTSSMPEVVSDGGLLLSPIDEEAWATTMIKLLDDKKLWQHLRQKGLVQAKKFSWQRAAKETLAVYEHVLSEPAGSKR